MTKQEYVLDFLELKGTLEAGGFPIQEVRSHRNREQKITTIYFKDRYISHIKFVSGEGYYKKGERDSVNVYCGTHGDTKYGAEFTTFSELVKELKEIEMQSPDRLQEGNLNRQQLLYIQSLFGTFNGKSQFINVTDKKQTSFQIEVYPSNLIIGYRMHLTDHEPSFWATWEDNEDVENFFRMASLL